MQAVPSGKTQPASSDGAFFVAQELKIVAAFDLDFEDRAHGGVGPSAETTS